MNLTSQAKNSEKELSAEDKMYLNWMQKPSQQAIDERLNPDLSKAPFTPDGKRKPGITRIHASWILHNAILYLPASAEAVRQFNTDGNRDLETYEQQQQKATQATVEAVSIELFNGRNYSKAVRYQQAALYQKKVLMRKKETDDKTNKFSQKTVVSHLCSARDLLKKLSLYSITVQQALCEVDLHLAAELSLLGDARHEQVGIIDDEAMSIFDRFKPEYYDVIFRSEGLARAFNSISSVWDKLGDKERALDRRKLALEGYRIAANRRDSINVAALLSNVGLLLDAFNDRKRESLLYKKDGLEMLMRLSEPDERIATAMSNLANAYQESNEREVSLDYYRRALLIRENLYKDHPHEKLASSLNNYGVALDGSGRREEGVKYLRRALKMNRYLHPNGHRELAISYANLGATLLYVPGLLEEANDYLNQAVEMFKETSDPSFQASRIVAEDLAVCYNNLGLAQEKMGNEKNATKYKEMALKIRLDLHGRIADKSYATSLACVGQNLIRDHSNLENRNRGLDYLDRSIKMFHELGLVTPDLMRAVSSIINNKLEDIEQDSPELYAHVEKYALDYLDSFEQVFETCSAFDRTQLTNTWMRAFKHSPAYYNDFRSRYEAAKLEAESELEKMATADEEPPQHGAVPSATPSAVATNQSTFLEQTSTTNENQESFQNNNDFSSASRPIAISSPAAFFAARGGSGEKRCGPAGKDMRNTVKS